MMPPETQNTLQQILADSRYQPRNVDQSIWGKLWDRYGARIVEEIKNSFTWISNHLPNVELPEWLKKIVAQITQLIDWIIAAPILDYLVVGIISGALIFAIYYYRHQIRSFLEIYFKLPVKKTNKPIRQIETVDLDKVAQEGDLNRLLEELRRYLRRILAAAYSYPDGLSDREMYRRIPKSDRYQPAMIRVIDIFEKRAFSGRQIEADDIRNAFKLYKEAK